MTMTQIRVGDALPPRSFTIDRAQLVRYAEASGDFNPIHLDERTAVAAGLPGVVAHGMLTMALAGLVVTEWAGDQGALTEYAVRFVRPVVVPADRPAMVEVSGMVSEVLPDRQVRIELEVRCEGEQVLGRARAVARLG
jgi:acyl dehydratase